MFRNKVSFYGEEMSTPRPTPKLEERPLLAVRECLFNLFAAVLHIRGRFSIRNPRTRNDTDPLIMEYFLLQSTNI
jgi:hypothetical protein